MKFSVGTIVDLYDFGFKQWRGEYIITKVIPETGLYKIKNTKNKQSTIRQGKSLANRASQAFPH